MQLLLDLITHLLLPFPMAPTLIRSLARRLLEGRVRDTGVWRRGRGASIVAYTREPAGGFRGLGFGRGVVCVGGCGGGCGCVRHVLVAAAGGGFVAVTASISHCCRRVVVDAGTCVRRAIVAVSAGSCGCRGGVVVAAGLRSGLAVECCAGGGAAENLRRLWVGFGVDGLVILVGSGGANIVKTVASYGSGSGIGRRGCRGLAARFVGRIAGWCTTGGGKRIFVGNLAGYFGRIGGFVVLGHASIGEEGILGIGVVVAGGTGLLFGSILLVQRQKGKSM